MEIHDSAALGALVRSLRQDLGLTQAVLANRIGVGRDWVIRLEQGNPRLEMSRVLDALAALGSPMTVVTSPTTEGDVVDDDHDFVRIFEEAVDATEWAPRLPRRGTGRQRGAGPRDTLPSPMTRRTSAQEDLCQALSVHPVQKYQSDGGPGVGEIADLFARRLGLEDRRVSAERFFRALAYNALIGGSDAHAKNYSLVLDGPRAQLAPLYDVASAAPYPNHKRLVSPMRIGRHRALLDIDDQDWARTASRLGLDADERVAVVEELRRRVPEALGRAAHQLPDSARETAGRMAEQIAAHVDGTWRPSHRRSPGRVLPVEGGGA